MNNSWLEIAVEIFSGVYVLIGGLLILYSILKVRKIQSELELHNRLQWAMQKDIEYRKRILEDMERTGRDTYTELEKQTLEDNQREIDELSSRVNLDYNKSYNDVDRVVCYDGRSSWHNGFISRYVNKLYPMEFPYMPERYTVMAKEYLLYDDKSVLDFDTFDIQSIRLPDGTVDTEHSAVFTCHGDMTQWEEISREEFESRKAEVENAEKEST